MFSQMLTLSLRTEFQVLLKRTHAVRHARRISRALPAPRLDQSFHGPLTALTASQAVLDPGKPGRHTVQM